MFRFYPMVDELLIKNCIENFTLYFICQLIDVLVDWDNIAWYVTRQEIKLIEIDIIFFII